MSQVKAVNDTENIGRLESMITLIDLDYSKIPTRVAAALKAIRDELDCLRQRCNDLETEVSNLEREE